MAASIHGILPPYRHGRTNDIDLIATLEAARDLARQIGAREYLPDRYTRLPWSIDGSSGTVNAMMLALNVSRPIVDVQGVAVTLACPLTVMVARCASVERCGRNRSKALLDAAHYHDLLPDVLPDGFVDLWRAISVGD